jgi:putative FmdB family regulatory protein
MPTYEYICEKCGHTFDVFQSMTADPLEVCPKEQCAKRRWSRGKVRRAIGGGAGLIFKGNGFYITDYRSDAYKTAAKKDAPASAPSTPSTAGSGSDGSKSPASTSTKTAKSTSKSGTTTAGS